MINNFYASQYADDTTLILDGSEESFKTCLSILKFYADISGLHINMEKTRVIWIGSKKGSEEQLCTETKLKLGSEYIHSSWYNFLYKFTRDDRYQVFQSI